MLFLQEQFGEQILVLHHDWSKSSLSASKEQPKKTFSSFEDMERFCVEHLLENAITFDNVSLSEPDRNFAPYMIGSSLAVFTIISAGSSIAKETRRGRGNIVVHGITYDKQLNDNLTQLKLKDEKLQHNDVVYSSVMPQDALLVLYMGTNNTVLDGPFAYRRDDAGYHLFWLDNVAPYVRIIPI